MTDYSDLVKRISDFTSDTRKRIDCGYVPFIAMPAREVVDMANEAAAAITALQAELDKVRPREVETEVCAEIKKKIFAELSRQEERGYADSPGGLEHMGDVWAQIHGWNTRLKRQKQDDS